MKTIVAVLLIASFLQATILPLDLVLIILICRSFFRVDQSNLYLAFAFGLLDSHLNLMPLGSQSLVFLVLVQLTQLLVRSRFSTHPILIVPVAATFLSLSHIINSHLANQSVHLYPKVVIEGLLALPIFYILRLWEERFTPTKDIKLRI